MTPILITKDKTLEVISERVIERGRQTHWKEGGGGGHINVNNSIFFLKYKRCQRKEPHFENV